MKTSTIFVIGLIIGALAVFAIRAASSTGGGGETTAKGGEQVPDPHAGHDMGSGAMPEPAAVPAAEPSPAPAPAPAPVPAAVPDAPAPDAGAHAGHDMKQPENLICPVMGNEVDPDIFVDHDGRRIGFCCPPCIATFKADPEKYLKKVDAELAARKGAK